MLSVHRTAITKPSQRLFLTATVAAAALALTACSSGGDAGDSGSTSEFGFAAATQEDGSTITVWVDASREPAADAFIAAHPDTPIKVETYDGGANGSGSFQTKITAFDQAGDGWPDVVFSTQNNDAAWASQGEDPFAAQLNNGYVDQSFLDGFTEGALAPVTIDDTVYGLRNDLAPTVTWYDQSLLDQFGYTLPTTWEEYEALGLKVAAEHPGYIIGSVGDAWAPEVYFWGAQAPVNVVTGSDEFSTDTSDPKSVAIAEIIDNLIDAGSLVQDSVFSPDFVTKYTGKVLLLPGPVWFSGALFQNADSLNSAAGTIGAGLPLAWDGDEAVAGNVGGGTWFVSSHSKNLAAAKEFLEFVTSSDEYQVELAPGLPAYTAAADKWLVKQGESNFFTGDFAPNLTTAASSVWDGWGYPKFSQESVWAKTVTPDLASGTSLVDLLPAWQTALENEAQVNGYTVK
ncbi:ABC transporter substrate-binding protein [Pengzhenrongella sicca]|uniref:Carbohydrate ABC transporter substrate-binding protein n=1 Tax=Pengzhenrongella sicca TaxID=2819238 RepID=A0A8A4Z8U8_9MICO|nr:ABC transporter substrate-binding protein [Pengzhenrongella sicca]QTE27895.1 carbohydrate ABC transporter substrate-binding protein [Pengzhenrongella sicca]